MRKGILTGVFFVFKPIAFDLNCAYNCERIAFERKLSNRTYTVNLKQSKLSTKAVYSSTI